MLTAKEIIGELQIKATFFSTKGKEANGCVLCDISSLQCNFGHNKDLTAVLREMT